MLRNADARLGGGTFAFDFACLSDNVNRRACLSERELAAERQHAEGTRALLDVTDPAAGRNRTRGTSPDADIPAAADPGAAPRLHWRPNALSVSG